MKPVRLSYREVFDAARRVASALRHRGLCPGDRIVLQAQACDAFLTGLFACLTGGFVAVPLSAASRLSGRPAVTEGIRPLWDLLDPAAALACGECLPGLREAAAALGIDMPVLDLAGAANGPVSPARHAPEPDDLALLLLTSGSTGLPKIVTQTHRALLSMADGAVAANALSPADGFVNWMPMEHIGSIAFLSLLPACLGATQVHAATVAIRADPLRWLDLAHRHRSSVSWAPNHAYGLVNAARGDLPGRDWDLSSLRVIANGGEAIQAGTCRRFLKLLAPLGLPPNALRPSFGMSETCSGLTWSDGFHRDDDMAIVPFTSLGTPIPGATVRVVDDHGLVLADGLTGRIQVNGPSVTRGYYNDVERNCHTFNPDGWFDTGDQGYLSGGNLHLTDREGDGIEIEGHRLHSHHLEELAEEAAGLVPMTTATCRVDVAGRPRLAVFFCPREGEDIRMVSSDLGRLLAERASVTDCLLVPLAGTELPRTSIGKIQRRLLRKRFMDGIYRERVICFGQNWSGIR